jgi:predicted O-methyltransferase YrrM
MAEQEKVGSEVGKDHVLAHLLSPDETRSRNEPEIASNIGTQLQHMALSTWSISILRRLRDAIGRLKPQSILEVGAGIGHRSAWIYDLFEADKSTPERYQLVEDGAKFAVIIRRLMLRHDAESYTSIVVGNLDALIAETNAWHAASSTGVSVGKPPLEIQHDAIIVDGTSENRARYVQALLPFLSPNGVLFTVEPDMPLGDVEEDDKDGMRLVDGFNQWMECIQETIKTHHIAFMPLFGGTLVAMTKK